MKHLILAIGLAISLPCGAQGLKAGAAQHSINPPIPSYIAGHSQNRTFKGIQDSLFVKVLVVANDTQRIAFITYDCIGMLYPHLQKIREKLGQHTNAVPLRNIVMSSTHSHAGPDVVGLWGPDLMHSGVDTAYMNRVTDATILSVREALMRMQPVKAVHAQVQHDFGWVKNISEPEELDRTVSILQFIGKKGRSVATLTNFACHPTFLDAVHEVVSADYPAGFYQAMDSRFGGVNLFLQGAIGGWVQPEGEPQTIAQAYQRGRELAALAEGALRKSKPLAGGNIMYRSAVIDMPVVNIGFIQLAKAGVIDRQIGNTVRTEIAVMSIGNAMFATHPGETVPAMSLATRKLMKTDGPTFVMGLSMDALGYIIKPYFFDPSRKVPHAEYLCSMSVGPETSRIVMETLTGLLDN
jgi:hypothetical protein